MSAPVDVLAVMDAERDIVVAASALAGINALPSHDKMRAAVAELMERERIMREALEDLRQQCKNNLEVGATGQGYWTDAQETIDAALARCGK